MNGFLALYLGLAASWTGGDYKLHQGPQGGPTALVEVALPGQFQLDLSGAYSWLAKAPEHVVGGHQNGHQGDLSGMLRWERPRRPSLGAGWWRAERTLEAVPLCVEAGEPLGHGLVQCLSTTTLPASTLESDGPQAFVGWRWPRYRAGLSWIETSQGSDQYRLGLTCFEGSGPDFIDRVELAVSRLEFDIGSERGSAWSFGFGFAWRLH